MRAFFFFVTVTVCHDGFLKTFENPGFLLFQLSTPALYTFFARSTANIAGGMFPR